MGTEQQPPVAFLDPNSPYAQYIRGLRLTQLGSAGPVQGGGAMQGLAQIAQVINGRRLMQEAEAKILQARQEGQQHQDTLMQFFYGDDQRARPSQKDALEAMKGLLKSPDPQLQAQGQAWVQQYAAARTAQNAPPKEYKGGQWLRNPDGSFQYLPGTTNVTPGSQVVTTGMGQQGGIEAKKIAEAPETPPDEMVTFIDPKTHRLVQAPRSVVEKTYGWPVQGAPKAGTQLQVSPDGTVTYSQGGAADGGPFNVPGKSPAINTAQTKIAEAMIAVNKIDTAIGLFEDRFATWSGHLGNWRDMVVEAAGFGTKETHKRIQKWTDYMTLASDVYFDRIHALTGVAINPTERADYKKYLFGPEIMSPSAALSRLKATRDLLLAAAKKYQEVLEASHNPEYAQKLTKEFFSEYSQAHGLPALSGFGGSQAGAPKDAYTVDVMK